MSDRVRHTAKHPDLSTGSFPSLAAPVRWGGFFHRAANSSDGLARGTPVASFTHKIGCDVSVWPAPYCAEVGDIRKVCS